MEYSPLYPDAAHLTSMRGFSSPHHQQSSRSSTSTSSDYERQKALDDESLHLVIHPPPDAWSLHTQYPMLNTFRTPDRESVDSNYTAERGIAEFTEVVLPHLFKHCKFASFVRQLNIYGFQRDTDARKSKDTKDKESCRWFHPYFRPGGHDLFHLIRRRTARYSRRRRAKAEEDVETVIQTGSGDESENDDLTSESRRSSSVSSAAAPQPEVVYEEEPPTTVAKEEATQTRVREDEDMREEQDLCMQLSQLKQACRKMQHFFTEQLSRADIEIEGQRLRIEQLEAMLRVANTYPPFLHDPMFSATTRIKTEPSGTFMSPAHRIQPTSPPPNANYGFIFSQDHSTPATWLPSYNLRRGSTPTAASAAQVAAVSSSVSMGSAHSDPSSLHLAYAGLPM
ncbi:stress-responsive transcription factor hsf1 [Apophysomyces sp. BC1021]|nr:stress-responsive transcription factor hsf1 [Apophysomyces sp. BC1021]